MRLFDSHCHLDDSVYDQDRPAVIERAKENGVAAMMIAGINRSGCEKALSLAQGCPSLYTAIGVHPHDAEKSDDTDFKILCELAADPKVRAWGEIGLDFNRMYSPLKVQENWFLRQLEMADHLSLPLIFHERDSDGRLLELLKTHPNANRTGVIHCFSGTRLEMEQYLSEGLYIGITGILTLQKRGQDLRQIVPLIPVDRLLIETDAPYLTPAPHRNKFRRNEPAFVKRVLLKLADVRNEDPESLAAKVFANTCRLFKIPVSKII